MPARLIDHRYETAWWNIELPERWSIRDDPECATFTANLKGLMQLSAYRKDSDIAVEELFELADEEPEPESVEIGLFTGLCNAHDTQGMGWKKWWPAKNRTWMSATDNVPMRSAASEILAAEAVLKTLGVRSWLPESGGGFLTTMRGLAAGAPAHRQ